MENLSLIPATALGYLALKTTTHPTSKFRRSLPNIKIKRLHLFPVLRFYIFGRVIHLHHWINFSMLLIFSLFTSNNFLDFTVTQGLLLGGIIHGLTLPIEHRRVVYKDFSVERLIADPTP